MNNRLVRLIVFISILIPIAVAVLLFMPSKVSFFGSWAYVLPHFNAIINSLTAFFLLFSFYMIKVKKDINMHKLSDLPVIYAHVTLSKPSYFSDCRTVRSSVSTKI